MLIRVLISSLLLLLAACGHNPETFNKTEEALFLRSVVDKLAARDFASIEKLLDPRLVEPDVRGALERTAAMLPSEEIAGVEPLRLNVVVSTAGPRTAHIAAEYSYPSSKWFVISAQLSGEPGSFRIVRFNVQPLPAPMRQLHAFSFEGKGVEHYAFIVATLVAFALSIYAFVICLRTPGLSRKWLWAVFTLLGFCAFTLNWSTGVVSINLLSFNLFSAAFVRDGGFGPWNLTFCIPVGALVFLWKHLEADSAEPAGTVE